MQNGQKLLEKCKLKLKNNIETQKPDQQRPDNWRLFLFSAGLPSSQVLGRLNQAIAEASGDGQVQG